MRPGLLPLLSRLRVEHAVPDEQLNALLAPAPYAACCRRQDACDEGAMPDCGYMAR